MRVFVAVELPPAASAAAAAISRTLEARVARGAPQARLTWVPADRMHLTIRFIGEVDPDRGLALKSLLAEPLKAAAFPLALGRAGVFPPRGTPRVLWLGVAAGAEGLRAVEQEVSARLDGAGIAREERPFSPHLTLARVRTPGGLRSALVLDEVAPPSDAGGVVDAITLFESRLSPKGPTYTALQRTPLHRA